MIEQEARSFKWEGNHIYIYGDTEGTDLIVAIPKRQFDQMVEQFFNVVVKEA